MRLFNQFTVMVERKSFLTNLRDGYTLTTVAAVACVDIRFIT